MEQPRFVEQTQPESVFGLLSDDNRVEILCTLWDSNEPMRFSELRDAVGLRDSGQFNYHLDKLTSQFVEKTDQGYVLTTAGRQINGAIEAGSYTMTGEMEPIEIDQPCGFCGGTRMFYYEDEQARVECDTCPVKARFSVPPSAFVGCDRADIPKVAAEYMRVTLESIDSGFCSLCDGPVEQTVCRAVDSEDWEEGESEHEKTVGRPESLPIVRYECKQCGIEPQGLLNYTLLDHPETVAFYYDHGINLQEQSLLDLRQLGRDCGQVQGTDPFRASVSFAVDGDQLTLVVDKDLTVVDTERTTTG